MGCTSSAQNTASSLANSHSDKDQSILEEIEENPMKEEKELALEKSSESNGIKVLPMCDTDNLEEPTHLDRHSKLVDTADLDFGTDSHANGHIKESQNENTDISQQAAATSISEDRLSHLEEVVEKVVELYENGELEITTEPEQKSNEDSQTKNQGNTVNNMDMKQEDHAATDMDDTGGSDGAAVSPSQSQCSRATRWEALADIAAELPPSLAVDPLTGQIYALSK